jgi:hypothetical protein
MPDDLHHRHARLERLRKLGVHRGAESLRDQGTGINPQSLIPNPGFFLPGEPVETRFGPAWVRTVRYPLAEHPDLAEWLGVGGDALAALGRDAGLLALEPARAAFVDTETTGLAIGAGTYTFMIGVGTYENACFVVRQFFMRHPGEERAQLHLVEEALGACTGLVSFNGRAFDLPLIQSRFVLARMPLPLVAAPHLDLLPPARRVWRGSLESCRLGSLEQNVLGVRRTEEDVPGWLVPTIYQDYYRSGVVSDLLVRVFYHNLLDITSMPRLAARLARFFQQDRLAAALDGLRPWECVNLAHCYETLEWTEAGIAAFRAALAGPLADAERAHALGSLAGLLKRLERREEAAALWEEWIGSVPGDDLTPYIELAKHHEWQTVDLAAARGWTGWALRIAERWAAGLTRDETLTELRHRLARIERKLAEQGTANSAASREHGTPAHPSPCVYEMRQAESPGQSPARRW